ncbi:hypothetical protein SADUNF_Sadunf03G0152100 [Salix dunnii]|uniref:non-specific serine/threonine protein kinase n=1 Tax=Salix dunnii TaxID=1413687 RepID=A0A835N4Z7_9ROSI|nr:hypothetical protein SADUNF_Sadunf03G0152100 [Salix dunnii]
MFYKCYVGLFLLMFKVAASIENGFVVDGNFELGGGAEFSQNGLFRLTNSSTFGVGRAFYSQPLNFKNSSNGSSVSFSTTFVFAFVLEDHLPGHGMAFMIAPSKNLTGASLAHYLGLFNRTNNGDPYNHVVAIELDTFQNQEFKDINSNHVGIDVNSLESVSSAPAGYFDNENGEFKSLVLSSGEPMQAWVEYDAPETQLNVTLAPIHTSKPSLPLLSLNIDISPIILEQMYVGFSSSTGQLVQSHYVLGWSFRLGGKAPELDLSKLSFFTGKEQSKRKGRDPLVVGLSITGVILLIIVTISILIILWRRKKAEFTEILEDWEVQVTEIESRDVVFLEEVFPKTGEVKQDFQLYEMENLDYGTTSHLVEDLNDTSNPPSNSGSDIFSIPTLMEQDHEQSQPRRSIREPIPRRRFEIEGEMFMIASQDDEEPQTLSDALSGFSERKLLGKGGFGKVYKGVLPGSNVQVAVKRISHNSKQGMKEFVAEIGTTGQLRHPNLVRVLGYCRGKKELILVYDYMPNGSLDRFLYSKAEDLQTTHVAGTLGYIAPELARSGKPTPSTDVYAFGAFCLEVACGRRPVEPKTSEKEMILVDWVYSFWMEGKILSTMDPKLDQEWKAEEAELVLKLGLLCSHSAAEGRPKMSQVLMYLKGQAILPENLNAHVKAQEGRGESENHAMLCYSTPSLTITNSLISGGR